MIDHSDNAWFAWAAAVDAVDAELRQLYADLDTAVAAHGPTCWISGRCCKFDSFGHRLYVTGLEIAWFLTQADEPIARAASAPEHDNCPWQINGLCCAHDIRPLGCRIFFCQQGTEHWQHELYERFLEALRKLHDKHELPYHYMEWRQGLAAAAETVRRKIKPPTNRDH